MKIKYGKSCCTWLSCTGWQVTISNIFLHLPSTESTTTPYSFSSDIILTTWIALILERFYSYLLKFWHFILLILTSLEPEFHFTWAHFTLHVYINGLISEIQWWMDAKISTLSLVLLLPLIHYFTECRKKTITLILNTKLIWNL